MSNVIAVTGTHGSGKSTLVRELEQRSKQLGRTVYVVKEVARNCPYPLGTVSCQEYIFHNQMEQEKYAMRGNFDTIICDRTILDNLVYFYVVIEDEVGAISNDMLWKRWNVLYEQAKSWIPYYDIVIRLPLNLDYLKKDDDPIRQKNDAYARRIDKLFDKYVEPFVTNHGWI